MDSNDLLGKHCSLLSCSLTCRSGRSRPAETGCHLNGLWHEGGLSSYVQHELAVELRQVDRLITPVLVPDEGADGPEAPRLDDGGRVVEEALRRPYEQVAVVGRHAGDVQAGDVLDAHRRVGHADLVG